jgi:hypothetical protein
MSLVYGTMFAQHLLIALLPWLVGVIGGGGLGYACAVVARALFSKRPALRRPLILVPWRTIAVTLPLLSAFVPAVLGLGMITGMAVVGLFVFSFAFPFTVATLLDRWHPSTLLSHLIAGARTLGTASVVVAAATAMVGGGGGAGAMIFYGMSIPEHGELLVGLSIVVLLALMVDVLLGVLQLLFSLDFRMAGTAQEVVE